MPKILLVLLFTAVVSCRDRYEPLIVAQAPHYLVVEGFINTYGDTATIRLSRTVQLSDTARAIPELQANLIVETEDNELYHFTEASPGVYRAAGIFISPSRKCRLRIITQGGKEYLSEFVTPKPVPPIDSVNWKIDDKGVYIMASTHDPTNATRYYRWEYNETWEFHSAYISRFDYKDGQIIFREFAERLYECWQSGPSTNIIAASSERLSDDIIQDWPLTFVEKDSWKLSVLYSILVTQYPTSKEGYLYLLNMKKNSEKLGTIFDPLPSELTGNIHCVSDPNERVIGFIDAGASVQKRMFIHNRELPSWRYSQGCEEFESPGDSLEYYFGDGRNLPTDEGHAPGYYKGSSSFCTDCRIRGTNIKPSFWP